MSILSTLAYQMYTNEYKSDLALTSKGSVYEKKSLTVTLIEPIN